MKNIIIYFIIYQKSKDCFVDIATDNNKSQKSHKYALFSLSNQ